MVQINGKVRAKLTVAPDISQKEVMKQAHGDSNVQKWLEGKEIVKEIYVPGKIVNIVAKD